MHVEREGNRVIVSTSCLRAVVDSTQGGNITLASFLPLDVPMLTTNYHSTDVYIGIEGIGGFYTTGDAQAEVDIVEADGRKAVIQTRASLAPRPNNPPEPESGGRAVRTYTLWDDLPVIRFDTEVHIDCGRADWTSEDARLVDMEANYDELDHFAYPGEDGEIVRGKLDQAHNGKTYALGQPWYPLYGERVGLTVRLDNAANYCYYWAENALINMGDLNIHGVAFLAQWSRDGRPVGPADQPFSGTFWLGFHEGPGPAEFECR